MSSLPYVQQLSKVIVAQIAQTIGWNSIQTTPLELLTDILHKYMEELTRQTQRYTELYGRTEPNLDDIALALNDLNINIADLEEYIANVDSVPCYLSVPKFPLPKESNLNFLKPGSKEVVTRPVHIHEHLPPILPHEETPPVESAPEPPNNEAEDDQNSTSIIQTYISTNQICDKPVIDEATIFDGEVQDGSLGVINVVAETTVIENTTSVDDENTFKKPFVVKPTAPSKPAKQPQRNRSNRMENAVTTTSTSKPVREIVSCFMTTGGFISPAREGKLPECRKPTIIPEDLDPDEIRVKQRSPSPEIIDKKLQIKRENQNENVDETDTPQRMRFDEKRDAGKEVKLYEVIQTVSQTKKRTKRTELFAAKEQKKQKKFKLLQKNRLNAKKARDEMNNGLLFQNLLNQNENMSHPLGNDKLKKKMYRTESVKKKQKKMGQLESISFAGIGIPGMPEKHKKKASKLSKKNLAAMGLDPNAIEGFAIPPSHDSYMIGSLPPEIEAPKEKKTKQQQKLSSEPDKQKIKIFKKLSSTNSSMLSKGDDDLHIANHEPGPINDDSYLHMDWHVERKDESLDLSDSIFPDKKSKVSKKLGKIPKEPKPPKIKKIKKEFPTKKSRTPKEPKPPEPQLPLTHFPMNIDDNASAARQFFPGLGFLDPYAQPGLIPSNPLFQSVRFDFHSANQNYPFAPNIDFANLSKYKRPNFNEISSSSQAYNTDDITPSRPLCNVAPLIPQSMLDMEMNNSRNQHGSHALSDLHSSEQQSQRMKLPSTSSSMFSGSHGRDNKRDSFSSPIIIDSDDDGHMEKQRSNPSQSPSQESQQDSVYSGEIKRKKMKDKSSSKKDKKDKELGGVKVKKKKDKKDKSKDKSKSIKHANRDGEKPLKDKATLKKEKREKKRERERLMGTLSMEANESDGMASGFGLQMHTDWPQDLSKDLGHENPSVGDFNTDFNNAEPKSLKVTLKLNNPSSSSPSSRTSRPSTPDFLPTKKSSKKKKKWRPLDDESDKSDNDDDGNIDNSMDHLKREPSPELARISALITRPPKQKSMKQLSIEYSSPIPPQRSESFDTSSNSRTEYSSMTTSTPLPSTSSGRGRPKGSSSVKATKSKTSKASVTFAVGDTDTKTHLYDSHAPIIDSQSSVLHAVEEVANEDTQVWICPACGKIDDGTPMIGCDGCDAWYHWVCVGIQVPPEQDQDWFCRVCIAKKQEDKKKKRKKKDKKDH